MVCKPRFITFYSSIIVVLCCLVGFSAYLYHYATNEPCESSFFDNSTETAAFDNATMATTTSADAHADTHDDDDNSDAAVVCHRLECSIAVLCTFAIAIISALMGFEGARRATSEKNCANCLFISQFICGGIALLGLVGTVILVSFPQLQVCALLESSSHPVYLTILLSAILSFLLLLGSILTGVNTRRNLKTIEYKSGAVY